MQAATDASLAVTYGTKWGRPQDVRTSSGDVLLGTSSWGRPQDVIFPSGLVLIW